MKKFLALFAVLVLCISLFAACKPTGTPNPDPKPGTIGDEEATLADAAAYLFSLYKDGAEATERDYDVVGKVMIGTTVFEVTWSVDVDTIKIVPSAKTGFYTVDLPAKTDVEIPYTLTATIKDAAGNTETKTFKRKVPVMDNSLLVTDPQEGVAYKFFLKQNSIGLTLFADGNTDGGKYLTSTTDAKATPDFFIEKSGEGVKIYTEIDGKKMYVHAYTQTGDDGKVSKFLTYAESSDCVWVYDEEVNAWYTTIGKTDYVLGTYSTYKTFCISEKSYISASNSGVSQFPGHFADKAAAEALDPAAGITVYTTPEEIVKAAYALEKGKVLSAGYTYTLTGVITKVNSAYDAGYGNITVTIVVNGMTDYPIECFRMKGDGADKIKKGDTITVKGELLKYDNGSEEGKVEFNSGCVLVSYQATGAAEQKFENAEIKPVKPVVGKPYKIVFVQENKNSTAYFLTGLMDGYYAEGVTVEADAADFYIENTTGGYYVYAMVGGKKLYAYVSTSTSTADDGSIRNHVNINFDASKKTVCTYSESLKTMVTTVNGEEYAIFATDASKSYTTLSPRKTSGSNFYGHFVVQGTTTGTTVEEKPSVKPEATEDFKEGVAYKIFLVAGDGNAYYAIGEADNDKFIKTTTNVKQAVDFYFEKSGSGYKIYFKNGTKKMYLDATTTTEGEKTSKFLSFKESTNAVFTYDKALGTWFTTVGGKKWGIGTYGSYTTISMSDASYFTADAVGKTQYVMQFVESSKAPTGDEPETPEAPEATEDFKENVAYKIFMVIKGGKTVYAIGEADKDKFIKTTEDVKQAVDFFFEKSGNGYKIFFKNGNKKMYLDASTTTGDDGHVSKFLSFKESTSAVFTYDKSVGVWFTTVNGAKYGIGTYGDFNTISMSDASYYTPDKISSQYVMQFVESSKAPTGDEGGDEPETPTPGTKPATLAEQIAEANKLANGETLSYESTITGTITDVPQASSRNPGQYKFTVSDGTNSLLCYYVAVTGGEPKQGDTITVTGKLSAFNGAAQFAEGNATATLGGGTVTPPAGGDDEGDDTPTDTAPVQENVAYNMFLNQVTLGSELYATHTISTKYIATTTSVGEAAVFYAEKVDGGWKFYTTIDGAKMYLHSWLEGNSKYIGYAATSDVVYSYDAEVNAWWTTINGTEYAVGTYNNFNTICISAKSYINAENTGVTQFPVEFVNAPAGGEVNPPAGGDGEGDEGDDTPTYANNEEILKAAYALENGGTLGDFTMTGVIISVDDPFSTQFNNVTVTIVVDGLTDYPIVVFRAKGTGADVIKVGDTITVTGTIIKYSNGTVEFSPVTLDSYVPGTTPDQGGDEGGENPPAAGKNVEFTFGAKKDTTEHKDTTTAVTTYTETVDGYTLSIVNGVKMYKDCNDAQGNSTLKFGTSSVVGSMSFTVPADVTSVVIKAAKYKANATKIAVNGVNYTLTNSSNDGLYDEITVDTTSTKTVEFTTVSGGVRCVLDSIIFVVGGGSNTNPPAGGDDEGGNEGDTPVTKPATFAEEVEAANKLANKEYLPYDSTFTGVVVGTPQASSYDAGSYKFDLTDGTYTLTCYYVIVTGGEPKEGDTVTVTGPMTAYNGKAQFDSQSSAVWVSAGTTPDEGGDDEGGNEGDTPSTATTVEFTFGANGTAHNDGNDLGASKSYTTDGYTLSLTGLSKVYGGSFDANGNSCIKLGTSKVVGTFSFTVPADVTSVVIKAAKYKSNATKLSVNGTTYTLTKNSNDGQYDEITIDTTSSKTVTVTTVSGGLRCMIDSITYVIG